jgi:hypothetical protein
MSRWGGTLFGGLLLAENKIECSQFVIIISKVYYTKSNKKIVSLLLKMQIKILTL